MRRGTDERALETIGNSHVISLHLAAAKELFKISDKRGDILMPIYMMFMIIIFIVQYPEAYQQCRIKTNRRIN